MSNLQQKEIQQFLSEVFKCYHDDGVLLTSFESIMHPIQAVIPFDSVFIGIIKDVNNLPHRLTTHEYTHAAQDKIDLGESIQTKISDNTLCNPAKFEQTLLKLFKNRYGSTWDESHFASKTGPAQFNFSSSPYKLFVGIYTSEPMSSEARTLFLQLMPLLFLKVSRAYTDGSIPALTKRQKEVLFWITEGKTAWDISQLLVVSERTVNFHLDNIFKKLGAVNRPHAVARAMSYGMLSPNNRVTHIAG